MTFGSAGIAAAIQVALEGALGRMGLVAPGEAVSLTPLTGGVSSNILRVDVAGRVFCVKQALAQLKVKQEWFAPISRNAAELAWLRLAAGIIPRNVPQILGHDAEAGLFAMAYLDPAEYPVWKAELRDGRVDVDVAADVAGAIVSLHAYSAGRDDVANGFAHDASFDALRLDPYLKATARHYEDRDRHLSQRLINLAALTAGTKLALVHGDVSPKNILVGRTGPVILDAECAWYGDPAFDAAFCLNHLALKAIWRPQHRQAYDRSFRVFAEHYLAGVSWEDRSAIEARIAALLPGLMLARIDGKSPVEYINDAQDQAKVRSFAIRHLINPVRQLDELADHWAGI